MKAFNSLFPKCSYFVNKIFYIFSWFSVGNWTYDRRGLL